MHPELPSNIHNRTRPINHPTNSLLLELRRVLLTTHDHPFDQAPYPPCPETPGHSNALGNRVGRSTLHRVDTGGTVDGDRGPVRVVRRRPARRQRQRTLEATLDWSYNLLDAEEQRVLRALGAFVAVDLPRGRVRRVFALPRRPARRSRRVRRRPSLPPHQINLAGGKRHRNPPPRDDPTRLDLTARLHADPAAWRSGTTRSVTR